MAVINEDTTHVVYGIHGMGNEVVVTQNEYETIETADSLGAKTNFKETTFNIIATP